MWDKFPVSTSKTQECKFSRIAAGEDLLRWSSIKGQQGKDFGSIILQSTFKAHHVKEGWMCFEAKFWALWRLKSNDISGCTVLSQKTGMHRVSRNEPRYRRYDSGEVFVPFSWPAGTYRRYTGGTVRYL